MIVLLFFFYGCIWTVPVSISHSRKKKGLPRYWALLVFTLMVEIAIVYGCLILLDNGIKNLTWLAIMPPVVASVFAGFFYVYAANTFDKKL